jgi:hypothetical protein
LGQNAILGLQSIQNSLSAWYSIKKVDGMALPGVTLDKTLVRNNIWAVDFIGASVKAMLGQGTANGK